MKKVMSEDGSYITIYLSDEDGEPTLKAMQEAVGGYIEIVYAENGDQIILDEEGRLKGKEINKEASEYWLGDRVDDEVANIVGDALILKGKARLE